MADVREVDYVVVGAGVMGAATAWALTRSARNIVVIEQFVPGHTRGSSHGRSRIFRLSYPDASYVAMAQQSLALWRRVEQDSGEQLLITMGGFDLGEGVAANAVALAAADAPFEELAPARAAERFPAVAFHPDDAVLYQPDAGIVAADRAIAAFLGLAVAAGAELRDSERVLELERDVDCVRVRTDRGLYRARRAIVTAGAWARPLLQTVDIDLPVAVTRETVGYYELGGAVPPPVVEWGQPSLYCLHSPGQGIKAAQHGAGPEVDPDSEGTPSSRSIEAVSAWVQKRFPTASSVPHRVETCLYTNTSDERFILEDHGPIVVGSPCSGHGFKFAPLIGTRLANLAEGLEERPPGSPVVR